MAEVVYKAIRDVYYPELQFLHDYITEVILNNVRFSVTGFSYPSFYSYEAT